MDRDYFSERTTLLVVISVELSNELRGTYAHSKLIPHIASWASTRFAVEVGDMVNAHYEREYLDTVRQKNIILAEKDNAIARLEGKVDELLNHAREQHEIVSQTQSELDNVTNELDTIAFEAKKHK